MSNVSIDVKFWGIMRNAGHARGDVGMEDVGKIRAAIAGLRPDSNSGHHWPKYPHLQ